MKRNILKCQLRNPLNPMYKTKSYKAEYKNYFIYFRNLKKTFENMLKYRKNNKNQMANMKPNGWGLIHLPTKTLIQNIKV